MSASFGFEFVISGDLRWGVAVGVVNVIVLGVILRPVTRRFLARYTNDDTVVDTTRDATGRVEVVEYFWRPG